LSSNKNKLLGDFIVRQKDVITYICAKTKNDISAAYHADSQDKLPFVGVSLNPGRGEFCASTVGRDVSIWNISSKRYIFSQFNKKKKKYICIFF
jgi:hypothetical protein